MSNVDQVIARALAEVAASRALRERMLAHRQEMQKRLDVPRPLYVLASKKGQLELPLQ